MHHYSIQSTQSPSMYRYGSTRVRVETSVYSRDMAEHPVERERTPPPSSTIRVPKTPLSKIRPFYISNPLKHPVKFCIRAQHPADPDHAALTPLYRIFQSLRRPRHRKSREVLPRYNKATDRLSCTAQFQIRSENQWHNGCHLCGCVRVLQSLSRRLARRRTSTVLARFVTADGQATDTRGEEREWVILALGRVEIVGGPSRSRAIAGRLERGLSSAAVKRASRVGTRSRTEVGVQRGVRSTATANARRQSVRAWRTSEMLAVTTGSSERSSGGREGSGTRSATHGARAHPVVGSTIHRRRIP